eukprot:832119-Prorocentrum_minimum.AAC.1
MSQKTITQTIESAEGESQSANWSPNPQTTHPTVTQILSDHANWNCRIQLGYRRNARGGERRGIASQELRAAGPEISNHLKSGRASERDRATSRKQGTGVLFP